MDISELVYPTETLNLFGDFGTTDEFLIDADSLILYLYINLISSPQKEAKYLLSPEKAQSITFFHYFETFIDSLLKRNGKFTILFIKENEQFYKNDTLKLIRKLCIEYYINQCKFSSSTSNVRFEVIETKWWLDLKKLFSFFDDNMYSFIFILFPTKDRFEELYDSNSLDLFIVASLLSFEYIVELNTLSFEGSAIDTVIYSKSNRFFKSLPKFLRGSPRKRTHVDQLYNQSNERYESSYSKLLVQINGRGDNSKSSKDIRIEIFKLLFNDQNSYLNRIYCIYLVLLNNLSLNDRGFLIPKKLKISQEILDYLDSISLNTVSYLNYQQQKESGRGNCGDVSYLDGVDLVDFIDFKLLYHIIIQIELKSIKALEDLKELFGDAVLKECNEIWNYVCKDSSDQPFESLQVFLNSKSYFNCQEIKEKVEKKLKRIESIDNKVYLLENDFFNSVAPNSFEYLKDYKKEINDFPSTLPNSSTRFVDNFHYHNNKTIEEDAFSVKLKEYKATKKQSLKNSQISAAKFKAYADSLNDPLNKLIINKLDATKEELEKEKLKKEKEEFKKSFNKNKSVSVKPISKPKSEREKLLEERLAKDKRKFEDNLLTIESPLQTLKFLNNLDYLDKVFDLYESYFKKLLDTYQAIKEKKLLEKIEDIKMAKFKELKKVTPNIKKSEIKVTEDMVNQDELELIESEKVPYYQLVQKYLRYFNNTSSLTTSSKLFSSSISENSIKAIARYLYSISKSILLFNDLANCLNIKFKLGKSELPVENNQGSNKNSIEFQIRETPETLIRNTEGKPDSRVRGFIPDKWQVELLDIVDNRESALICAPTSSGKTFISFYTFEKILRQDNEGIVVFIAPTKALVNQMYAEVLGRYEKNFAAINHRPSNNKTVGIFTRDWRLDMENCQILITVPQCLEILFNSIVNIQFIQRIRYVIFDEVHQVCNTDGAVWERLLLFNPCPFLALSATIGNLEQFYQFLKKIDPKRNVKLVHYTHRFNDLKTFFISRSVKKIENIVENNSVKQDSTEKVLEVVEKKEEEEEEEEVEEEIKIGYDSDKKVEDELDQKEKQIFDYNITPLHPFASLSTKKGGLNNISSDLNLISSEAHELYIALLEVLPNDKQVLQFDPQVYFSKIKDKEFNLEKQQISKYQNELKEFYNDKLTLEQKQQVVSLLSSPLFDDTLKFNFEKDITDIVLKLQQDKFLPAIIFCFNRTQCTRLAQTVYTNIIERNRNPNVREEKKRVEFDIERVEKAIAAEKKQLDLSDPLMLELERLKVKKASLDYIKPQFGTITSSDLDKDSKIKNNPLAPALLQGIGVHHSGLDKNYLRSVEFLFRSKKIQLLFATSSLAVGVNLPCSTVIFAGDSPYLNVLTYRQGSGRAGRRNLDIRGSVGFLGISKGKISRLINSKLSNIVGNSVLSPSLCLSLSTRYDFSLNGSGVSNSSGNLVQKSIEINESNNQAKKDHQDEIIKDSWDNSDNENEIKDSWDNSDNENETKPKELNIINQTTQQPTQQPTQQSNQKQQTFKLDIEILKKATKSLLNNSFFLSDPLQVQFLFSFSIDYLFREGFLDKDGVPLGHSGLVTHLSYLEPFNFIFVSLLKSGAFDNLPVNQKDRDLYLIHILSYLFCIQPIPSSLTRSPSILVLPPPPPLVLNIIQQHNKRLLETFSTYSNIYTKYLNKNSLALLPFSKNMNKFNDQYKESNHQLTDTWNKNIKQFKSDSNKFKTIDSLSGIFNINNIEKLKSTFQSNTFFSTSVLPYCEVNNSTNSYLLDFYKHGQAKTIIEHNGIKESDIWTCLKEFCLTLKVIEVALQRRDPDSLLSNAFTGLSSRYLQKFGGAFNY